MTKAIEAAARALSERGGFALAGDWDAQVQHDQRMIEDAQAAITAYLAAMKAEGFVMVPVEPTAAIERAGANSYGDGFYFNEAHAATAYRAMIAASTPHDDRGE